MQSTPEFTRVPEAMQAADVGPYLRSLREHYKLSVADVAARLHIRAKYIEAIEQARYDLLPSKVYGRGYVASYAEFLGIDPQHTANKIFGEEIAPKPEQYFIPEPVKKGTLRSGGRMHIFAIAAIGFFLFALVEFLRASSTVAPTTTVAQVPQELLASARTMLMPLPSNQRCIDSPALLACTFYAPSVAEPFSPSLDALYHDIPATPEGTQP